MLINPFTPTAGAEPPRLIGRDQIINDFSRALTSGVGAPARLMRVTGPRGSGKTVLLTDLGEQARKLGWTVVDVAAGDSLLEDLTYKLSPGVQLDKVSLAAKLPFAQAGLEAKPSGANLEDMLKSRANKSKGLLVTVDEVQDANVDDMRRIASAVQMLIRDKVNIAFVFAGLPMGVMDLINGKALTFLRRAQSEELTAINQVEVGLSMQDSFESTGFTVTPDVLSSIAHATGGYAYLIQLVGFYVWQRAALHIQTSNAVTERDALEGEAIARERFYDAVMEPAVAGLSQGAVEYLLAIAQNGNGSTSAKIAARMGRTPKDLSSFRRTLLQREVIQSPARGYVEFAIPFMREYLEAKGEELLDRYE